MSKAIEKYKVETGKDWFVKCCCCGAASYASFEFVEWLVNWERVNCVREAREMASYDESTGIDALNRYADQIESLEPFTL